MPEQQGKSTLRSPGSDHCGYTKVTVLSFSSPRRIKFLAAANHREKEIPSGVIETHCSLTQRSKTALACRDAPWDCSCCSLSISCGGGRSRWQPFRPPATPTPLTSADVQQVVQDAAQSADAPLVIAVADRAGKILAVFRNATAPVTSTGNFGATVDSNELAVALARTAALFSNNQAPLSSRTVRFISGIHFPPGVSNAPNADLYGIENTNRGCPLNATFLAGQSVDPSRSIDGLNPGLGVITGKADVDDSNPAAVNPGGVPLFKNGSAVGGIGVVSTSAEVAEFAAFSGASQAGFLPTAAQLPPPGVVIIGGIALPFVNQTTLPNGISPGSSTGTFIVGPTAGSSAARGRSGGSRRGSVRTDAKRCGDDYQSSCCDGKFDAGGDSSSIRFAHADDDRRSRS